jgi:radical SAM superfamily enzyme YgiQ (UPF0313 family)
MKVLLINPPIRENYPPNCFPLGLAYIAAVLQKTGHDVQVLDINAYRYKFEDIKIMVNWDTFNVIGITGMVTQYSYIKKLTLFLKEYHPNIKIIVGGPIGSTVPKLMLEKTGTDICIVGEGEITIVELLSALNRFKPFTSVDGIAYKENDKVIFTKPRELIKDLDTIPFPAWDLFPVDIYVNYSVTGYDKNSRNMAVLTSRGCYGRCSFCWDTFGKKVRFRSPKNVIEEFKILKEKYNINRINPYDETFTANKKRVIEICDLMIKEKLNFKWDCGARVNTVDEELLKKLKEAGVDYMLYGIESGSQTILNEMHKDIKKEQATKAIRMTRKLGIEMITPLMIGFPSESKETIQESIDFFTKENIYCGEAFFPTPHPGAPLYEYTMKKGLIEDEEKYLETLGEFTNLHINLTNMSDEELICLKKNAEKKIFISYFIKNIHKLPLKIIKQIQTLGFKRFFSNVSEYIGLIK